MRAGNESGWTPPELLQRSDTGGVHGSQQLVFDAAGETRPLVYQPGVDLNSGRTGADHVHDVGGTKQTTDGDGRHAAIRLAGNLSDDLQRSIAERRTAQPAGLIPR